MPKCFPQFGAKPCVEGRQFPPSRGDTIEDSGTLQDLQNETQHGSCSKLRRLACTLLIRCMTPTPPKSSICRCFATFANLLAKNAHMFADLITFDLQRGRQTGYQTNVFCFLLFSLLNCLNLPRWHVSMDSGRWYYLIRSYFSGARAKRLHDNDMWTCANSD